ncbi:MAG: HD domain-containing protein [Brevefilum sp.]|nr:HD domain-containing protein [Brevefilum sp.]
MPDTINSLTEDIAFIAYIDGLKNVVRVNRLFDGSRQENTAEHSWHAALSALILAPYANEPVDVDKVIRMLLIHDLIEIEAGDTFAYDQPDVLARQEQLEIDAAQVVFGKMRSPLREELRALWDEFEARVTPESKFAKAIDRFMPIYSNIHNGGEIWLKHGVSVGQVRQNIAIVREGSTQLADQAEEMVAKAAREGVLVT